MSLRLGDTAPDFQAETTAGPVSFHDWLGENWAVLFSHPRDFTPVCTTELGYVAKLKPEFEKRNVKAIGLSVDPVESHKGWASDIKETQGSAVNFPIVADPERKVANLYGMMHPAHDEVYTVRTVFVIDPSKKIRLMITSWPCFQFAGVATLCFAVSCSESMTRRISSKLRPVVIG